MATIASRPGWNFSIPSTSSFLNYTPYADGINVTNGWSMYFSGEGFVKNPGDLGAGNASSITSLDGASLTFPFIGQSIYLFGTANCSYDVVLDNEEHRNLTASNGTLLYNETLSDSGSHRITLTGHPKAGTKQQLAFESAIVSMPGQSSGDAPKPIDYDNSNAALKYNGNWTSQTDHQIPSTQNPAPYHETGDQGANVSLTFSGGSAIAIWGSRNYGHWSYSVDLDSEQTVYNGSTFWLIGNSLLFYKAFEESSSAQHTVTLTHASDSSMKLTLNSFQVYSFNPNSVGNSSVTSTTAEGVQASATGTSPNPTSSSPNGSNKVQITSIINLTIALLPLMGYRLLD